MQSKQKRTDISSIIGWVLQGGVIVSSAVILIGMILLLRNPEGLAAIPLQAFPHTAGQIWAGLWTLQPLAIIVLGLLLLMVTPVIRVAVSIIAFGLEQDRLYVVITFCVLAILCMGYVLGKGGA
ncbi:MAG TPA: DUF1634 domain-containing protein [Ktedonobacteraceae bacterium]|jgi:uncharacterized membrane protein|nr:DUF1634 domain-containing protein [Ktedonobacteraceae bacterium]